MNSRHARLAAHDLTDLTADDHVEEVSSVRHIAVVDLGIEVETSANDGSLDLEMGVDIDAFAFDRSFGDPTPVYGKPYNLIGGQRCNFPRDYFLGTRFESGIIESPIWEQEMRAAGMSDLVVARCRRYLSDNAL